MNNLVFNIDQNNRDHSFSIMEQPLFCRHGDRGGTHPAPERAVDTEGDCGGVLPISLPYEPGAGGVGDDRMPGFTTMASSESTAERGARHS